jgi:hypothetical protein
MMIFLYIIAAYGLTNLLVFGTGPYNMLGGFRKLARKVSYTLGDMLDCMMCTSANVGWILSLLNLLLFPTLPLTPFNIALNNPSLWYIIIPADLCFTSGIVWLIHTVQERLESSKGEEEPEE